MPPSPLRPRNPAARRCRTRTDLPRRAWLVAAIASLLFTAAPARADDRADRETARQEFAAGQAADKAHDWQGAIVHYLRANELVPHAFTLFNIAADHEHLGSLREAAIWYQRYLDAAPTATNRDAVLALLAELKARPAPLTVRTTPPGAQVTIDGARAGKTPLATTIRGGAHRIAIDLDGEHAERTVDVLYAEPVDVDVRLPGPTGTLEVRGEPAGALVIVDRAPVGRMPIQLAVAPGEHAIHVEHHGYQPFDTTAIVTPRTLTSVVATLAPGGLGAARALDVGYFVGAAGGADTRGAGAILQGEVGARIAQYEGLLRIGRVAGELGLDFLVRWAFLKDSRVTPYVGVGYSYLASGLGYQASLGLRYDLSRDPLGLAIRADVAARSYQRTRTTADGTMLTEPSALIPITVTVEAVFR